MFCSVLQRTPCKLARAIFWYIDVLSNVSERGLHLGNLMELAWAELGDQTYLDKSVFRLLMLVLFVMFWRMEPHCIMPFWPCSSRIRRSLDETDVGVTRTRPFGVKQCGKREALGNQEWEGHWSSGLIQRIWIRIDCNQHSADPIIVWPCLQYVPLRKPGKIFGSSSQTWKYPEYP